MSGIVSKVLFDPLSNGLRGRRTGLGRLQPAGAPGASTAVPPLPEAAAQASHATRGKSAVPPPAPIEHGGLGPKLLAARASGAERAAPQTAQRAPGSAGEGLRKGIDPSGAAPKSGGPADDIALRIQLAMQEALKDAGRQDLGKRVGAGNQAGKTLADGLKPGGGGGKSGGGGMEMLGSILGAVQGLLGGMGGFGSGGLGAGGLGAGGAGAAGSMGQCGTGMGGASSAGAQGQAATPFSSTTTPENPSTSNAVDNTEAKGKTKDFLDHALAQKGDRYVYGAETNLNDPNPNTFDCSELVQWSAARSGVNIPDGSANQLAHCRNNGTEISVQQAINTPGALLFRQGHVAISLGNGKTIEARGSKYGVGVFNASGRFTSGGLIPGMQY